MLYLPHRGPTAHSRWSKNQIEVYKRSQLRLPSPTWARQKLFPSGFSRTHVDDGTHLSGCTQSPAHRQQVCPPRAAGDHVQPLFLRGRQRLGFPWSKTLRRRVPLTGLAGFLSAGTTHAGEAAPLVCDAPHLEVSQNFIGTRPAKPA